MGGQKQPARSRQQARCQPPAGSHILQLQLQLHMHFLSTGYGALSAIKLPAFDGSGLNDQPGASSSVHPSPLITPSLDIGSRGAPILMLEKSFRTRTPPFSTVSRPHGAEKFPDG